MISGTTTLVAHLGYPTHTFKSPLICNPWFEKNGIDAVVVPMGIKAEDYPDFFRSIFTLTNIRGALITMPHKVTTMELVDEISRTAAIAGATNAVLRREDGALLADQFDGAGFVRGVLRKGFDPSGKRGLVVGSGGVGSPIAGKSTIARRLARQHGAAYFDKMSARFVEAALVSAGYDPGDREANAFYRERILPLEY